MSPSIVALIVDLVAALGHVILEAFRKKDAEVLRKVTDILPKGHVLRSRVEFELQDAIARDQFGVDDEDTEK